MQNTRLDEAQAGIKIARRNINNLRYPEDTTHMAESKELKSLLMKVKEEGEKAGLKQHSNTKIMTPGPITSWQPTTVFLPEEFQGRGAWWATVHGVSKSWTQLSD